MGSLAAFRLATNPWKPGNNLQEHPQNQPRPHNRGVSCASSPVPGTSAYQRAASSGRAGCLLPPSLPISGREFPRPDPQTGSTPAINVLHAAFALPHATVNCCGYAESGVAKVRTQFHPSLAASQVGTAK